jgi:hypothetical protein
MIMRPYGKKRWFVSLVFLCWGAAAAMSYAGDWEFFHYYESLGMARQKDIKVYLKVEKHQGEGEMRLLVKDVALDKDTEGCRWLTTIREYCMDKTCTGEYQGSTKKGVPVKEKITSYIVNCVQRRYSTLGTEWYGFDGSRLGRSYWEPAPAKPGAAFPSEDDTTEEQLRKILAYVCNQYK